MIPTIWRNNSPSIWDDMFSARRDFDRLFDRYLGRGTGETLSAWAPSVDVQEDANEITVAAELPGVNPQDVNVTVENGVLTISGEKNEEREEGKADSNYHMVERRYGRFERSFSLPSTVEADSVKASYENGVLRIKLPKTELAKPRRIEVQAGNDTGKKEIRAGKKEVQQQQQQR